MAKTKTKAKPSRSKPASKPRPKRAKTAPAQPNSPIRDDLTKDVAVLAQLKDRYPPLDDVTRASLDSLADDHQRAELGGRTQARLVFGEAARWAVLVDAQLRENPSARAAYSPKRFVYFLDAALALAQGIRADRMAGTRREEAGSVTDRARAAALSARTDLLRVLRSFAGRREAFVAEIDAALGTTERNEDLVASLGTLSAVAARWLDAASRDLHAAALADVAGLTPRLVDAARSAADALAAASSSESAGGRRVATDSPVVNVREGAVLLEMREIHDAFENAKRKDPSVALPPITSATRAALASHSKGTAEKPPTPAEPPGAGAPNPPNS